MGRRIFIPLFFFDLLPVEPFPSLDRLNFFTSSSLHAPSVLRSSFTRPFGASESRFGRKEFWDETYKNQSTFSWYCSWSDIEPLWLSMVPNRDSSILVPGCGNDDTAVGLFDAGYRVCAFDYAPEGILRTRENFGTEKLGNIDKLDVRVADARSLPFDDRSFDAAIEKGTLDSVFLSGGRDKACAKEQLRRAVQELTRTIRPGGIVVSLSAPATGYINDAFEASICADTKLPNWNQLLDGSAFVTEDGFASINVNAVILAWERN